MPSSNGMQQKLLHTWLDYNNKNEAKKTAGSVEN